jgi:hypothetical protein
MAVAEIFGKAGDHPGDVPQLSRKFETVANRSVVNRLSVRDEKPLRGVPPIAGLAEGQWLNGGPFWQNEPKIFSIFQSLGNSDFG